MNTFALFVAPWDLAERGTADLLRWAKDQGINAIYLASAYHAGWFLHPHHRRKSYMVEDGSCYFHPTLSRYGAIRPRVARLSRETDWIAQAREQTRKFNLKLVLWTVCLHNTAIGLEHPDVTCRNAYGDSYPHALCPSHPAVRQYVCALIADQATTYEPDGGFLLEATGYHRGRTHGNSAGGIAGHHHERDGLPMPALEQHLLNLSFAESDVAAAGREGVDAEALRARVREHLDAFFDSAPQRPSHLAGTLDEFRRRCPALAQYERVQSAQVDQLVTAIKDQAEVRDLPLIGDRAAGAGFGSVVVGCYNQPPESLRGIVQSARAEMDRAAMPKARPGLIAAVRLGFNPPPATPSINSLAQARRIARTLGELDVDGMAFYFYGEAPRSSLGWIGPMIRQAQNVEHRPTTATHRSSSADRMLQPIGVGLIGAGAIGEVHLKALSRQPGVFLASVFDSNALKAAQLAERTNIGQVARSADELLENPRVKLVVVATPPVTHVQFARLVLQANKHLMMEKPLGMNLGDADHIVDAAAAAAAAGSAPRSETCVGGVALVHRYDGARFAARDLIRAGAVGRVRLVRYRWGTHMYNDPRFIADAQTDRRWLVDATTAGGGILPSASIHALSVISFLLDGEPRYATVSASVRQLHPRAFAGIEDDVSLQLQLDDGIEVCFDESWAHDMDYEMSLYGDAGEIHLRGPSAFQISLAATCDGAVPEKLKPFCEGNRLLMRPGELEDLVAPTFEGLAADMISACRGNGRGELPDLLHARNMRAVIAAALESSARARKVPVNWRGAAPSSPASESLADRALAKSSG